MSTSETETVRPQDFAEAPVETGTPSERMDGGGGGASKASKAKDFADTVLGDKLSGNQKKVAKTLLDTSNDGPDPEVLLENYKVLGDGGSWIASGVLQLAGHSEVPESPPPAFRIVVGVLKIARGRIL